MHLKKYRISEKIRIKLKQPLGQLVVGNPEETMRFLKREIAKKRPKKLFAIGDFVTLNLIKAGIEANLYVVDNKIMRKKIQPIPMKAIKTIQVKNPPGTITLEAFETIQKGANSPVVIRILVDGEEDLLTLPAIKFAPKGTLIIYGQPMKGLVMVKVTKTIQEKVEHILKLSEI
jgi:uncharacterized protein (UPF0218 family)